MTDEISRNAPCPCGSGKKYKHCCLGKTGLQPGAPASKRTGLIVAAVAVAVIALFAWTRTGQQPASDRPAGATAPAGTFQLPPFGQPSSAGDGSPSSTPRPYEYDALNNRHWDPNHGHWHSGPPPPGATPTSAETPKPYEYDAVNNRHWDPDHGHWHDGPPPVPATPVEPTKEETKPAEPAAEESSSVAPATEE